MLPAYRADQFLLSSYRQGWRVVVAIGTAVAGKSGEHKPEAVQQFRTGAEGAADPGYPWPLSQGQGSRNVKNFIYLRFGGLGLPSPGVGGKGLQVTAGAFCIEDAQSQEDFPEPETRRFLQSDSGGHLHLYFSDCGLWRHGSE